MPEYRTLVRLFADHPGEANLFSIHNMCQVSNTVCALAGETARTCAICGHVYFYSRSMAQVGSQPFLGEVVPSASILSRYVATFEVPMAKNLFSFRL